MRRPAPPAGLVPTTFLVDACVLYSRVLRDYLLYAMRAKLIHVVWSETILGEVTRRLMETLPEFTQESADRLVWAMNTAFPYAQRDADDDAFRELTDVVLPDENDRHVIATAIGASVDAVCTHNVGDFPVDVMQRLRLALVTPDDLLCDLIRQHEAHMLWVHRTSVESLPGSTDESTLLALTKAGAPLTATLMGRMLG